MTESRNTLDKEQLRAIVRKSMESSGPLHIDKKYLSPDFKYYWALKDENRPAIFQNCLDHGYTYTTVKELPGLLEDNQSSKQKYTLVDDDDRIAVKINTKQVHYFMKIPIDRWKMIQEIKQEDYDEKLVRMKVKLKSEIQDGTFMSGSLISEKKSQY